MSQIITPTITQRYTSTLFLNPPTNEEPILFHDPALVVDIALKRLHEAKIVLREWRASLYRRYNVPIVVKDYSYVVPDDQLSSASEILTSIGLPLSTPSRLLMKTEGDFQANGRFHRITTWTAPASVQHIVLYPFSFSHLDLSGDASQPFQTCSCASILVPPITSVYASILRLMTKYPPHCSTMTVLRSDLSELIGYHLLQLEGGYVDSEDDEEWNEKEIDNRLWEASRTVRSLKWEDGEEWMGDALSAIVTGRGTIENLPHRP